MIGELAALMLQAVAAPPSAATSVAPDPCPVDRATSLALSQEAFDQDLSGGWRVLAERPGCEGEAAQLIRDYRTATEARIHILYWHEGQLRANIGQYAEAIRLMEASRKADDRFGWNPYVDATVAFLRGDRTALVAARATLAELRRPPEFHDRILPNGFHMSWPPNLVVVDGLIRCFGRPYREAYGLPECREPGEARRNG
jgi:hypothetical protein